MVPEQGCGIIFAQLCAKSSPGTVAQPAQAQSVQLFFLTLPAAPRQVLGHHAVLRRRLFIHVSLVAERRRLMAGRVDCERS